MGKLIKIDLSNTKVLNKFHDTVNKIESEVTICETELHHPNNAKEINQYFWLDFRKPLYIEVTDVNTYEMLKEFEVE